MNFSLLQELVHSSKPSGIRQPVRGGLIWYSILRSAKLSSQCRSLKRRLYSWEMQEARRVFGAALDYDRVCLHECATWTNSLNRLAARLRRQPSSAIDNAVTLGNHCYFPVRLPDQLVTPGQQDFEKLPWLIHELTHVWQFQRMGWKYFFKAVSAQIRKGPEAYRYGDEQSLLEIYLQGFILTDFNLEQQGEITRDYYRCLAKGADPGAFQTYIDQLQQSS